MSLSLLLMMASFIMVKTARDAMFFTRGGIESLPQAYLGISLLAVPVAMAALGLMRAVGMRRGRLVLPLLASVALVLLAPPAGAAPGGARPTVFFVFVPLVYGVLFSVAWLLGGRMLEGALYEVQVEAFRWMGAASILGGVLGGLAARLLAARLDAQQLLAAGCVTLLASGAVMAWTQHRHPPERSMPRPVPAALGVRPGEGEALLEDAGVGGGAPKIRSVGSIPAAIGGLTRDVGRVGADGYVRRLVGISMAGAVAGVLVEFLFYMVSASSTRTAAENAKFFAGAYLLMNSGALVMQVVFFQPLQRRLGVTGTLMALPLMLLGGSAALLAGAGLLVGQGLKIAEGGLKQSIHRSSWERAFLPVIPRDRWLAKMIVDGAGARMAEGVTAVVLMLWMRLGLNGRTPGLGEVAAIGASVVGASMVWLGLSAQMRRELVRHAREFPEDRCRPDSPLPDG